MGLAGFESLHLCDVAFDVAFPLEAGRVHVTHLAKDRALEPGTVVLAENPRDVGKGVRRPAAHAVLVVNREGGGT